MNGKVFFDDDDQPRFFGVIWNVVQRLK